MSPATPPNIPKSNGRTILFVLVGIPLAIIALLALGALVDRINPPEQETTVATSDSTVAMLDYQFWDHATADDVQALLDDGVDLHLQDDKGWTALHHWAAGDTQDHLIPVLLLDYGADVSIQNNSGHTPLQFAVAERDPTTIQLLLDRGGETQLAGDGRMSLLRWIPSNNPHAVEVMKLLIGDADININQPDEHGRTLLHNAASGNENANLVQFLIDQGASVHVADQDGETPLHGAAEWNEEPEDVQVLLVAGAEVDARNNMQQTPLHLAIRNNQETAVIMVLLANGASRDVRGSGGGTPLEWAELYDRPDVVNLLITDEERAQGKHCVYKGLKSMDENIMARLEHPDSYWPHHDTMRIGHQFQMETVPGRLSMVHDVSMEFSARNSYGQTLRGTAYGVMFNENCFVAIQDIR